MQMIAKTKTNRIIFGILTILSISTFGLALNLSPSTIEGIEKTIVVPVNFEEFNQSKLVRFYDAEGNLIFEQNESDKQTAQYNRLINKSSLMLKDENITLYIVK